MLKHRLQQNLKRRDGSCQDDQKERLFSARVVGSGGRHAFVPKLVSGGLFMLRKKGMYCLLCRKHKSKSAQNRSQTFSSDPSTRFKWSTVKEHMSCANHQTTVMNELLNQVSHFQKQVDQKESSKLVVLQEAFHTVYWTYTWGKGKQENWQADKEGLQNMVAIFWQCHIAAVCSNLPSILQTLRQLKADPSCYGLLKKLMKVKKIGIIYILCELLPVLSDLSRVFQSLFARRNFPHLLRANLQ